MSMKKNALAVALVAGLGLAGVAAAYQIQTNNDDIAEKIAASSIADNTTTVTMAQAINIKVDPLDFIVGRTTGFNVRVELDNGAKFANNPTITLGTALPCTSTDPDNDPTTPAVQDCWTVTLVAGGTGNTFAVYAVTPPAQNVSAVQPGEVFNLTNVQLNGLSTLKTSGNTIPGTVRFIDPVGASEIGSDNTILLQSGNPVTFGCNPNAGEINERIDVGVTQTQGSKTYFSSTGNIGQADNGTTNLGAISTGVDTGFSFAYTGADTFSTVVTGNFAAFFPTAAGRGVFLSTNDTCTAAITPTSTIVNSTETQVTFNYTAAQAGFTSTGGTLYLCAQVPAGNTQVIDATTVSAVTTFTRNSVSTSSASCGLLPLQYNGSVVKVYHVNPAGNSTAQSFIRVINPTSLNGRVTIVGVDDEGVSRGPVTFTLNGQKSLQINSQDLEAGSALKGLTGSLGDGAGKWRLFVTGEFAGMVVQSLNRNSTDGTVTNLTDADTRDEQVHNGH